MTKGALIDALAALLREEHAGCDDNTCIIRDDFMEQYPLLVIDNFCSSGAASRKFQRLTGRLRSKYKSWWKVMRRDAGRLCRNVPHMTCTCNAVIWDLHGDYSETDMAHCSSCAARVAWKPETDKE